MSFINKNLYNTHYKRNHLLPNSYKMGTLLNQKLRSKSERRNWEPLSASNTSRITVDMLTGKRLTQDELNRNANYSTKYRIP